MLDKRSKAIVYIFCAFLLLLIISETTRPKPINWNPSYVANDTQPFGSSVFYEELPSLFPESTFETVTIDPFEFLQDTTAYKTNTAYLFLNDYIYLDENQTKKMKSYVAAGNTVFISSNTVFFSITDTISMDARIDYEELLTNIEPDLFSSSYKPDSLAQFKRGMYKSVFREVDTLHTTALGFYTSEDEEEEEIDNLNFVQLDYGEGQFFFHTIPEAFSNYYILRGNEHYTAALLSYVEADHFYLDAYKKSGRKVVESPMRFVFNQAPLTWAYYLLLGGLLIFVIFRGKREQRIIEVVKPLENTSIEFTKTIGDLYFQHKDYSNIISKKITYFLESVRTRYYLKTETLDANFIKKLALKSSHSEAETEKLIRNINQLKQKVLHTEADLIELNKQIEAFRL